MISKSINTIKTLRINLIKMIEGLSTEQFNEIPANFNNNIIWNVAHLIAAQEAICYIRSGLPTSAEQSFVATYKPGTRPEGFVNEIEIEKIKTLLLTSVDQLANDYDSGLFKQYTAVTTRYGVELTSVEDAIEFLPFHEGFHMGYIAALKRSIVQTA
ncbi:DinB family protein [Mucilaginibacter sp.]|uniref:DinB family protein n=1 Tax=Mucilaginibacter sp. TaxID=1882438 RepID=UPI003D1225BF